jgi:lipopolysaccharide/colanic/teichoic acid biosynthesis glycosyltransferase
VLYQIIKRLFDFAFSLFGLVVFSPLMAIIAVLVKLASPGPVVYKGTRAGKAARPFRVFKFRTMVVNAEEIGGPSTSDDDSRITRVGTFLRKYKLDELPQLINVLKGEMSIVGPRPEVPMEVDSYNDEERRILTVKPGITDYASVTFHNEGEILKGSSDPHQAYREKIRPEKLRLALKYVDDQSFLVDLKIILQTVVALVKTRT